MSVESILKVERLTKDYRTAAGPLTVLKEVSFDLVAGASLAIVGPSGSGKTTLLGLCAGLDRASGGTVTLAGSELGALDEDGRARCNRQSVEREVALLEHLRRCTVNQPRVGKALALAHRMRYE